MSRITGNGAPPPRGDACDATDPLARPSVGVEQSLIAPIVVAVDGSAESGAALRVAAALAARDDAPVEAVLREGLAPRGHVSVCGETLRQQPMSGATKLGRVRRQLCEILESNAWNLHVDFGSFGPAITALARTAGASLIVLGLRRHHAAHRLSGGGAVVRVLRSAEVPVLAVERTARALPHTAVAAIDLSPASLRAARAARDLLARPGTLFLVHVEPAPSEGMGEIESWQAVYHEGVSVELERLASELAIDDVKIVPRLATGALTATLVEVARSVNAELIACGASDFNAFERLVAEYTPLELLRSAECSVLIAPSSPLPDSSKAPL